MTKPLQIGDEAPAFSATAVGGAYGNGKAVSLEDFQGKTLVLYFYPKDKTPGCTTQACGLRDNWTQFEGKAEIFGVSADSPWSHRGFIDKYSLPFPLLSDETKVMVEAYGVWKEKNMYGKKYMGIERTTFVIGPDQKIKAIFPKVKPGEHAKLLQEVL